MSAESQAAAACADETKTHAASTPSDSIHPREQPKPGKKRTRNRQKPNVVSKNQQANTKKARPQSSSPVPLPSSPRRSAIGPGAGLSTILRVGINVTPRLVYCLRDIRVKPEFGELSSSFFVVYVGLSFHFTHMLQT